MTGIKASKMNGLTIWQVIIRGCIVNTYMSEAAAKTQCLRIVNTMKQLSK